MTRTVWTLVFILFFLFIISKPSFAQSPYVLPYPSYMPGNVLYKPRLVLEKVKYFIYFGDFARFDYYLGEADHYLVEAKTLFEYKQYLLGLNALKKSNDYFAKIKPNLEKAKKNGKIISEKQLILKDASEKHIEVLSELNNELPEEYYWDPEKIAASRLFLKREIQNSIKIRQKSK